MIMNFNMTEEEKASYHCSHGDIKSNAYYDNEYLKHLKSRLKAKGKLNEKEIESLYNIFLKSFKHSAYAMQEVVAFINDKRINKAECE
jgi:hypothetical protein